MKCNFRANPSIVSVPCDDKKKEKEKRKPLLLAHYKVILKAQPNHIY